jgi:hypothetical protein
MSYNMMIGYEIYDRFTIEDFTLRQRMTLTTKIYCSLPYLHLHIFRFFIINCHYCQCQNTEKDQTIN